MPPTPRGWLLLAAGAFALTSIAAGLLLYLEPTPSTVGSAALALGFGLVCLHLATRGPVPQATSACGACGGVRDPALSFCAKCGT